MVINNRFLRRIFHRVRQFCFGWYYHRQSMRLLAEFKANNYGYPPDYILENLQDARCQMKHDD